jgi:hypothetical protein
MKFKSRKGASFKILLVGAFVFFILLKLIGYKITGYKIFWPDAIMVLLLVMLLWLYFGTEYELTPSHLKYRSGPLRGKVEIQKIKEIIKNTTLWSGLKPATANNGLIIKYGYDEIYISPESNDLFIENILQLNPGIKITSGG